VLNPCNPRSGTFIVLLIAPGAPMLRPALAIAENLAGKFMLSQGRGRLLETVLPELQAKAALGMQLESSPLAAMSGKFLRNMQRSNLPQQLETIAGGAISGRANSLSAPIRFVEGREISAETSAIASKVKVPHLMIDAHSADHAFPYLMEISRVPGNVEAKLWQKSDGIMQVHIENKVSTGFFIDDGLMVSANHGIANDLKVSSNIMTMLPDGTLHPARLLARSANEDIALLRVSEVGNQVSRFELASATKMQMRDPIYAMGFPQGNEAALSAGRFASIELGKNPNGLSDKPFGWIRTAMPSWSGCSGGPMLNADGKAVGVLVRAHSAENEAFATASEHITSMVDHLVKKGLPERGWIEFESVSTFKRGELAIKDFQAHLVNG